MRRALVAAILLAAIAAAGYWFAIRDESVAGKLRVPPATATIGSGEDAVAVGPDGRVLSWVELPEDVRLPQLPLDEPPPSDRLAGPALRQARVLGAAPPALRPYIESSHYSENGVAVELRGGIELRFGDASRAAEKWEAASAVLADPSIEALDYVDLHAPGRPAVGGSGHALPPVP